MKTVYRGREEDVGSFYLRSVGSKCRCTVRIYHRNDIMCSVRGFYEEKEKHDVCCDLF